MLWWRRGLGTMALNRCCNTRKLNRPVGHPQLWWTRLFLADAALGAERTMLAAAPRPSQEGSAGPLVNRRNRDAHGEGGSVSLMGRRALLPLQSPPFASRNVR